MGTLSVGAIFMTQSRKKDRHEWRDRDKLTPSFSGRRRFKRRELRGRSNAPYEQNIKLHKKDMPLFTGRRLSWITIMRWGLAGFIIFMVIAFLGGLAWKMTKEAGLKDEKAEAALTPQAKGSAELTLLVATSDMPDPTVPAQVESDGKQGSSGKDRKTVAAHADMLLLVARGSPGRTAVISIPPDTQVRQSGSKGPSTLAELQRSGGTQAVITAVAGLMELEINHYIKAPISAITEATDALGGVRLTVIEEINDPAIGKLSGGDRRLNGRQAEVMMLARGDINCVPTCDSARLRNQLDLTRAVSVNAAKIRNPLKVKKLIDICSATDLKTDYSFSELREFMMGLGSASGDRFSTSVLAGSVRIVDGRWYFAGEPSVIVEQAASMAKEAIAKEAYAGCLSIADDERLAARIVILNSTGEPGLAASVAADLQLDGFINLSTGNASRKHDQTTVYFSDGREALAGVVGCDLRGIDRPLTVHDPGRCSENEAEIVIVVGGDYISF